MTKLQRTNNNLPATLSELRKELDAIASPEDALKVADRAALARDAFKLIGRSIEECNPLAEVYMLAHWRFGDFVKDIAPHRPIKGDTDSPFPGTKMQRKYARHFREAANETDIEEYVRTATAELEQASISGCLDWLNPGRHGNLKGEYEWYTPERIIEAARAVMGGIDLDPASCEQANEVVGATKFFTEKDDGLTQTWHGRVFLNPPFAHPVVKYFAEKLLESLESGEVEQATFLSNACVDVGWWQSLVAKGVTCFHLGRIQFYGPDGKLQPPTLGQAIIYLGPHADSFRTIFSAFGVVLS